MRKEHNIIQLEKYIHVFLLGASLVTYKIIRKMRGRNQKRKFYFKNDKYLHTSKEVLSKKNISRPESVGTHFIWCRSNTKHNYVHDKAKKVKSKFIE